MEPKLTECAHLDRNAIDFLDNELRQFRGEATAEACLIAGRKGRDKAMVVDMADALQEVIRRYLHPKLMEQVKCATGLARFMREIIGDKAVDEAIAEEKRIAAINCGPRPTAEEVCHAIEMALVNSDDESELASGIYKMVHCREGSTCKNPHKDWVQEFRVFVAYWENVNKAPSDPTKIEYGSYSEFLSELREIAGDGWDGVDVNVALEELRASEGPYPRVEG